MIQQASPAITAIIYLYLASTVIMFVISSWILYRAWRTGMKHVALLGIYLFLIGLLDLFTAATFIPDVLLGGFSIEVPDLVVETIWCTSIVLIMGFTQRTFFQHKNRSVAVLGYVISFMFGVAILSQVFLDMKIFTMATSFSVVAGKLVVEKMVIVPLVFGWQVHATLSTFARIKQLHLPPYVLWRYLLYAMGCLVFIASSIVSVISIFLHFMFPPPIIISYQIISQGMVVAYGIISLLTWVSLRSRKEPKVEIDGKFGEEGEHVGGNNVT